ncbi:Uncharacterized protein OS=freshwater metagenome GN=GM51_19570 PE=4 SV=1: DUF3109 [Tuwongella immobilis]|uniref:DUF3109 family protein n=2 Tax=Tuwongella immobilis TaxID=692036 RepID=A0A6C2YKE8_9BACT|nr:Uncharacterized protein OS=freshwater metagenome GN=GM51_19570 PE=4 SV=1: DUF3109 [Tuwongella immobilis]VTR98845.1 Uncharacterized protein OS=freshwater metagenome GN=GM51_19570 PE=4 SV=1: DUF3109 [Tuwongella immobilis]
MSLSLPVVNLETAKFDCIFGRGCEGICCQNGRPSVEPEEAAQIEALLPRIKPLLRPDARKLLEKDGYLSNRKKLGFPMLRVIDQWCIFFNQGCVLHTIGMEDGKSYAYKPSQCALFPIQRNSKGQWYVRQWGYEGEQWDLFCLNPAASPVPASESLRAEMEYAAQFEANESTKSDENR